MSLLDQDGNEVVAHVPLDQFRVMQNDLMFLTCLRHCGVDNWDGWDDAVEMHKKMKMAEPKAVTSDEEIENERKNNRGSTSGTHSDGDIKTLAAQNGIILPTS